MPRVKTRTWEFLSRYKGHLAAVGDVEAGGAGGIRLDGQTEVRARYHLAPRQERLGLEVVQTPVAQRQGDGTWGADMEIRHNVLKSINNIVKLLLLVTLKYPAQN